MLVMEKEKESFFEGLFFVLDNQAIKNKLNFFQFLFRGKA